MRRAAVIWIAALMATASHAQIMVQVPNLQGPTKAKAAEKGLICHRDLDIGSWVKSTCRCASKADARRSFGIDIYAATDEQRSRVYYDAAECDASLKRGR